MKLAIVTPLPPQHTGIADYASDLIIGLKDLGCDIDLFSNAKIDLFEDMRVYNIETIEHTILNDYDVIIYQMGNNTNFHLYMVELIKKYQGIVHLHDMVLHHIYAWTTFSQNKKMEYFDTLEKWYGKEAKELLEEMVNINTMPWDSRIITHIPLFEEFIQYADACIVHSDFVKKKIKASFPYLDTYHIHQLYKMPIEKKSNTNRSSVLRFGIFGGVDPQKQVDTVLKVFAEVSKKKPRSKFHLVIVGGIDNRCDYIVDLPKQYNLEEVVEITGRVEEEVFMEHFTNTDILIALRYPTMGETSAVVMRALQLGIPCIVNDVGWYNELPEHVIKIPVENMESILEDTLSELLNNKGKLRKLRKKAYHYSKDELNFDKGIYDYSAIIQSEYRYRRDKFLYQGLGKAIFDLKLLDDPTFYTPILDTLDDLFQKR